jgi:hypothetical protein
MGKTHGGVVNRYGLNFLNVEDQIRNWHALSTTTQLGLSEIIGSNWERRNSSQWGIKKRVEENIGLPQAEHLLLLNMVELGNMVKGGERVVFSNLINHQGFNHPNITRLNFIDPREAKTRIGKIKKEYKPSELMANHNAMILLFPSPEEIHKVGEDTWRARERYNNFFRGAEKRLHQWVKQGSIRAFFASHEISLTSIWGSRFRPHTHAVIWLTDRDRLGFLENASATGEVQSLPEVHNRWRTLHRFIPYIMRVSRIAPVYRAEFPEEESAKEIIRFNTLAVQAVGKLVDLWKHTNAGGKDRISKSGIPTRIG